MRDSYHNAPLHGKCAVIVAHPDDETLWAGGTILMHSEVDWTIVSLCRKSDPDRAPKFFQAAREFAARGFIGDMDDEPEQRRLSDRKVKKAIMELVPSANFDIIITHSTAGEYTRHLRHEETGKAVSALWKSETLAAGSLWAFAYEDGNKQYLPRPVDSAEIQVELPNKIWQRKYEIITNIYGFDKDSFEAKTTPRREAFYCFHRAVD